MKISPVDLSLFVVSVSSCVFFSYLMQFLNTMVMWSMLINQIKQIKPRTSVGIKILRCGGSKCFLMLGLSYKEPIGSYQILRIFPVGPLNRIALSNSLGGSSVNHNHRQIHIGILSTFNMVFVIFTHKGQKQNDMLRSIF